MRCEPRCAVFLAAFFVLGWWCLVPESRSAGENKAGVLQAVQKVADALQAGAKEQARKMADDTAKGFDLEDVMKLMDKRGPKTKHPVFGFGDQPRGGPDGIEAKLLALAKRVDGHTAQKEAQDIVKMAFRVQAIGEIARVRTPEKDDGQKKRKNWIEWSDDMVKESGDLASAAKTQDPATIKAIAGKLNATCNNCHGVFRD
jgi:hypothetical protein